jgi:hypothetical protein
LTNYLSNIPNQLERLKNDLKHEGELLEKSLATLVSDFQSAQKAINKIEIEERITQQKLENLDYGIETSQTKPKQQHQNYAPKNTFNHSKNS